MSSRSEQLVESYLEATACLVDAKISAVAFDKTLPYSITKNDRKGKGIYTVSDKEITFDVYSEYYDLEVGQKVYVTIPNGDFSERKFISNIIKDEETTETKYNYRFPMDSLVLQDEEIIWDNDFLTANQGEEQAKKECKFGEIQNFVDALDSSLTRVVLSCKIQTLLQNYNIVSGHYGFGAVLLTKNLSMGYDNYDEAEDKLEQRFNSQNFENVDEGIEYLNSLIQEISEELGKSDNTYWTLHNLQVSSQNMIGNLYKHTGQQLQAKGFDVSQLNSLSFVIPYIYQDGDFQQAGLTSNFELQYENNENYHNLIYNDLKISWGYAQEDYNQDTLILGYYGRGLAASTNKLVVREINHSNEENVNYLNLNASNVQIQIDMGSFGSIVGGWNNIGTGFKLNRLIELNYEMNGVIISNLMTDYKPYINLRANRTNNTTLMSMTSKPITLFQDISVYKDFITTFDLYIKDQGGKLMSDFYLYDENGVVIDPNYSNQTYYAEANLPESYLKSVQTISIKWIIPCINSMIKSPLKNLPSTVEGTYYATLDQLEPQYFNNQPWFNNLSGNVQIKEVYDLSEPKKLVSITYNEKKEVHIEYTYLDYSAYEYSKDPLVTYNKFYFFIEKNYSTNKVNNYIQGIVNANSVAYKVLDFGTQSVYGSKYAFYIAPDDSEGYEEYIRGEQIGNEVVYSTVRLIPELSCVRENPVSITTQELMQKALSTNLVSGVGEGIEWSLEDSDKTFLKGEKVKVNNKWCYELRVDNAKITNIKRNCSLVKCRIKIEGRVYVQYYSIPFVSFGSAVVGLNFNPIISYTHQGGIENNEAYSEPLGVIMSATDGQTSYINDYDTRYWQSNDSKIGFRELNDTGRPLTVFTSVKSYTIQVGLLYFSRTSYTLSANTYYYLKSDAGAYFLIYVGQNPNYFILVGKKQSDDYYLRTFSDSKQDYAVHQYNNGDKGEKLGTIALSAPALYSGNNSSYNYKTVLQTGFLPLSGNEEVFNQLSFSEIQHDIGISTETPRIGQVANFPDDVNINLKIMNTESHNIDATLGISKCFKALAFTASGSYDSSGRYYYVLKDIISSTSIVKSTENNLLLTNTKNTSIDYINKKDWTQSAYMRVLVKKLSNEIQMRIPQSLSAKDFPLKEGNRIGKLKKNLSNLSDGITFSFPNGANENTVYSSNSAIVINTIAQETFSENEEYYYLYVPHITVGTMPGVNVTQRDNIIWAIEINKEDGDGVQKVNSNYNLFNIDPEIGAPSFKKDGNATKLVPYPLYVQGDQTYCISAYYVSPDQTTMQLLWHQPLIIKQNLYKEEILNDWNGELILDDVSQLIMSSTLGAGKKDNNNLFSGVFLGAVSTVTDDTRSHDVYGLYGYSQGRQAFGFRDDGTAFIGTAGRGRLIFDGKESTISSGGYNSYNPGMFIDLDDAVFNFHINTVDDNNSPDALFKIEEVDMQKESNNIPIIEISKFTQRLGKPTNLQLDLISNTITGVKTITGIDESALTIDSTHTNIITPKNRYDSNSLGTMEKFQLNNCKALDINLPFSTGHGENQKNYETTIWEVLNYLYTYLTNLDDIDHSKAPEHITNYSLQDALGIIKDK